MRVGGSPANNIALEERTCKTFHSVINKLLICGRTVLAGLFAKSILSEVEWTQDDQEFFLAERAKLPSKNIPSPSMEEG